MKYVVKGTTMEIKLPRSIGYKGYSVECTYKPADEEDKYWLGSSYCNAHFNCADWGMYYVYAPGYIYGNSAYHSFRLCWHAKLWHPSSSFSKI